LNAFDFIAAGVVLLAIGGEAVLRGGIGLCRSLGLPAFWIGLITIPLASALPLLFVSSQALVHGAPEAALGSILGAGILDILLVLGFAAAIRPLPASAKLVLRDGGALLVTSAAVLSIAQSIGLGRVAGLLLLAGLVVYFVLAFATDWRRPAALSIAEARGLALMSRRPANEGLSVLLLVFGLASLYFGSRYFIGGGLAVAATSHIAKSAAGLAVAALAASIPVAMAAWRLTARGHAEAALGFVLAACLVNLLGVLGLLALVQPLPVTPELRDSGLYVLAGSAALLIALLSMGWRLARWQGFVLLLGYAAYLGWLAWQQGLHIPAI
jgi:cation:H+ antiporter